MGGGQFNVRQRLHTQVVSRRNNLLKPECNGETIATGYGASQGIVLTGDDIVFLAIAHINNLTARLPCTKGNFHIISHKQGSRSRERV